MTTLETLFQNISPQPLNNLKFLAMKLSSFFIILMPLFIFLKSDCNGGGRHVDPADPLPFIYKGVKINLPESIKGRLQIFRNGSPIHDVQFEDNTTVFIENGDELRIDCTGNDSYSYIVQIFNNARAFSEIEFNYIPNENFSCGNSPPNIYLTGSIENNSGSLSPHYTIRDNFRQENRINTSQSSDFRLPMLIYRNSGSDHVQNCISQIGISASPSNNISWQVTFNNVLDDAEIHLVINDQVIKGNNFNQDKDD